MTTEKKTLNSFGTLNTLNQKKKPNFTWKNFYDILKDFFTCAPPIKKNKKTNENSQQWTICNIFGFSSVLALFVAISVLCGAMWFTDLYVDSIINQMTIRPESTVYEAWRKPPLKPLICIYVYNYTNMNDYSKGIDKKIKLQELGPYCYRETLEKKNITFNDNGTITYGDTRKHVFEQESSNGTLNDTFVVPNLALIGAVSALKNKPLPVRWAVSLFLKRILLYSNSMINVRAEEFFFGYDDKLINITSRLAKQFGINVPLDKFGILTRRAATTDETITVATGTADLENIGVVTAVNGEHKLNYWSEEECNRIDGSDGAFFPRHGVNKSATIYLFHKDLCRRIPFIYKDDVEFQDGIIGMRFRVSPKTYVTNGTCYCPKTGCAPDGVFDLSPCSFDVPVMMSFPHFLYGDESLINTFEGLHPDPKKHQFFLMIQPILSFTLGTISRLQLNIRVEHANGMTFLREFPNNLILPVVWLEVLTDKMPPDLFNLVYHSVYTVRNIQIGLQWGTLTVSLILAFFLIRYLRRKRNVNNTTEKSENKYECYQEMLPKNENGQFK